MKTAQNSPKALVLGATGRFGRNMCEALAKAGWNVTAQSRKPANEGFAAANIHPLVCDIADEQQICSAASKADVIVHGINPLYSDWEKQALPLNSRIIELAKQYGTTLLFPGNVYNYGADMPPLLGPNGPYRAKTKKGQIRIRMEQDLKAASAEGLQVIVLRVGDFLENPATDTWFDRVMIAAINKGRFTYPGKTSIDHAWAYLPDAARAGTMLLENRNTLPRWNDIPFAGSTLSGAQMRDAIQAIVGRPLTLKTVPWFAIRLLGLFNPMMRELIEMRYLWDTPHALDGSLLREILPDYVDTPPDEMFAEILRGRQITTSGALHSERPYQDRQAQSHHRHPQNRVSTPQT